MVTNVKDVGNLELVNDGQRIGADQMLCRYEPFFYVAVYCADMILLCFSYRFN